MQIEEPTMMLHEEALRHHNEPRPGKIEVTPTKPCLSQSDLSLAYALGVKKENLFLVDSKGVIYKGRNQGMNPYKERFAVETERRTLEDAVRGANVLIGLSWRENRGQSAESPSPSHSKTQEPDNQIRGKRLKLNIANL